MTTQFVDIESAVLDDHLELARADVSEAFEEHVKECPSLARCLQCRELENEILPNRLALARLEYAQKVLHLDRRNRGFFCIYCGVASDHRDHLLPRGWTGEGARRLVPTVPACSHCNVTISDHPSPIIAERAAYVAARIRDKNLKELKILDKTEEELLEFGERLQSQLRARQFVRQLLRVRLLVLDLGGLPEVPDDWLSLLTNGDYQEFSRSALKVG